MNYSLNLTDEAQLEETEAYNYYENIRPGLWEDLLMELEKCYNKVTENPFYYSFVQNKLSY